MNTYVIKNMESNKLIGFVEADGFTLCERGMVLFYRKGPGGEKVNTSVMHVGGSTLVSAHITPSPAVVKSITR